MAHDYDDGGDDDVKNKKITAFPTARKILKNGFDEDKPVQITFTSWKVF